VNDRAALTELRNPLRIAVVTETYPPEINGVAMTIAKMAGGLAARGHAIQLVRPSRGKGDRAERTALCEEVLLPGMAIPGYDFLKMGFPAGSALRRLWTKQRPDVVHIVTEGPLGWSGVATAARLGIPCSSDFHTNFHSYTRHYGVSWLHMPVSAYLRRFHNRTARTLVPTDSLRDELVRDGYLNVDVVARGVDTRLFTPVRRIESLRRTWGAGPSDLVVTCVSRVAAEKNLYLLLRAFRAVQEIRRDARLVVVGDGPERPKLEREAPDVVFAGMRTGYDLAAHYASADLFLYPSVTETYGNVTVEAMASGLPVVAYDYAAAEQHIRHGSNGMLAPVNDEEAFTGLACTLADNRDYAAALGREARRTAEGIDWEHVNDAFERTLIEVAARSTGGEALLASSAS
jgi:glycosyltransferase involved in cell wall biosynthesis